MSEIIEKIVTYQIMPKNNPRSWVDIKAKRRRNINQRFAIDLALRASKIYKTKIRVTYNEWYGMANGHYFLEGRSC